MLASILNSDRAIIVNIRIVRIFTRMRQLMESHAEMVRKLEQIEKKDLDHDRQILLIFKYLKQLEQAKKQQDDQINRKKIGFRKDD